jgi:hypothetical protein
MSDAPRFVVSRLNWRPAGDRFVCLPGETRLASFESIEAAEADRTRREAEVRARLNPFRCGTTWPALTTIPQPVYLDWLQDAGVLPPVAWSARTVEGVVPLDEWVDWWQRIGHVLSAEQVAHVWNGLNRVRFFEVIERPASAVAFAVVRVEWEFNDSWFEPGAEGGAPFKVFRRWAAAEEYRRELEHHDRGWRAPDPEDGIDEQTARYDVSRWAAELHWPLGPSLTSLSHEDATLVHGGEAPLYEVIEVELPDLLVEKDDE